MNGATAGSRILVIDDEQGIREGCLRALRPAGFRVETAATLAEGRRRIEAETFDLVLLDVMLPDGQGTALLRTIRQRDADTVAVIITGFATVELAVDAIKQGAYDFISKPFDSDLLLMTVNQALEKRSLSREARRLQALEEETARLEREREEMQSLDRFKSAFMLTVAHELRSPVAAAQSLLRTMLRGLAGELNDQQREIVRRVEVRHAQLLELINDLLSLAASKTYDADQPLQPVALPAAVQRALEALGPQAQEKGVQLSAQAHAPDLMVQASPDGLDKVLVNLIGNAVKYTPSGGRVVVEWRRQGDQVELTIQDSGIGIAAEDLPRLGSEFFRGESAKRAEIPGTGLGLSIVQEQLRRFGGRLQVTSTPGQGSTFAVRLPLSTHPG
jgi:signal transduction histidine kinase